MRTKVFMLSPLAWACLSALAQTLPTGGTITQGAGSVAVNGNGMVVNQSSPRMVADWQSFSIGAGNSVRFVQPSSSAVALNRVLGSDASRIFGSLSANGHVYLQNPNGVLFAPGAQVDVGSLVATTLRADVGEFMVGRLRLAAGDIASGSVINEGMITTAPGGHVVLAGPQVGNAGRIATPGGTTALVAAGAVNVDPTGSGLLSISVPVAALNAQLAHRGSITADGGAVLLQAAATDAARRTVMQVDGIVRARSIEQRDGQIVLAGGSSGIVAVSGTLDASGGADARGGSVKVLGDRVALLGAATLDASGGTGGGTVRVGGNWQGRGPEANAQATVVGSGVRLDASARERGDGGTVVVWSDGATTFAGQIDARGGTVQGNGGQVEVSGKQLLNFAGTVDTRAPAGREGSLLLDPFNLEIGTVANIDGIAPTGDDLTAANLPLLYGDFGFAPTSQITAGAVAALLATTDVQLQASNSINVIAPIGVAAGGGATTLTLNSPTVTVGAALTLNNAALLIDTDFGVSDTIRINAPVSSLRSVALTSSDIGINAVVTAPQVTLSSNGVVNEGTAGGIVSAVVSVLQLAEGSTDLNLTSANNRIGSLTMQAGNADVRVDNPAGTPMSVQGSVFGDFSIAATGGLVQSGALSVSADTQITTAGTDAVVLTNAGNVFSGPLNVTAAAGDITLAAQGPLQITGRSAGDVRVTVIGGTLTLGTAGINTTGALIELTSAGFIDNSDTGAALATGAGGRFFIRSSDFAADALGSVGFGTAATDINHIVLGGWTGAAPASGNVYLTNAVGTITTPVGDTAAVSRVYDGSTAFTYTQAGAAAATAAATGVITTAPGATVPLSSYTLNAAGTFADKNVGTDKAYTVAPSTDVIGTGSGGEQYYGFSFAGFTRPAGPSTAASVVTPRAITSRGIAGVDRVYDGTTVVALNTGAAILTGVVTGDGVTLATGGAGGAIGDKNVGTAKPVLVSGLALAGADAANYTLTDASGATATITPRPITSSGLTAVNRVYDGTSTVALDATGASLAGTIAGDTVSASGGSGTMANKNAGTAKPVSVAAVTLAGTDAGNYSVSDTSAPTVDIAVRAITSAGVNGVDRAYDGTTAVAIDASGATLTNAVVGDAVGLSTAGASGTMSDKNVGTAKPVAVTGLVLAGADAANYSLVDASAATVSITPLGLTPAGITAVNRVVDGTTTVTLNTSGATVVGAIPGDVVGVDASGAVGAVATPDPGFAKPVTVSGLALTGTDAINYAILATPIGPTGEGLTVRILSVTAAEFESIRYKEYLQGVSDAQEPFRRAMAEALASGFGKENIRKQLTRGLVFETGLAPPAIDTIEPAAKPASCTAARGLACGN